METKKVTLKELKEMEKFTGVNKKGVKAEFTVNGESAVAEFEDGTQKEMKLDSVRRSWLVVIENNESKEEKEMNEVNVGYKVKDSKTGEIGVVVDIHGKLVTVLNDEGDFPANIDNLEVIETVEVEEVEVEEVEVEEVEVPIQEEPKQVDEPKKVDKPKKQKQGKRNSAISKFKGPEEVVHLLDPTFEVINMLDHEEQEIYEKSHTVTDFQISGQLVRIYKVNGFTQDVSLYDANGQFVHKAERFSLKSMLDFMGFSGAEAKEIGRTVRRLSKEL